VESWIRGDEVLPTKNVHNEQKIRAVDGRVWNETRDHSKYFTDEDGTVVGIGDLNRMKSQWKRGGSFYILQNNTAFAASVGKRMILYTSLEADLPEEIMV